jgi:hypothetical protein
MASQVHKLQVRCLHGWAVVLILGALTSVHAQSTAGKHTPCGDYDTQSAMNQCAAEEAKAADHALNTTYLDSVVSALFYKLVSLWSEQDDGNPIASVACLSR